MVHIAQEALHCIAASTNLLMVMVGDAHASKAFVAELDKLKAIDVCSKGSLSRRGGVSYNGGMEYALSLGIHSAQCLLLCTVGILVSLSMLHMHQSPIVQGLWKALCGLF